MARNSKTWQETPRNGKKRQETARNSKKLQEMVKKCKNWQNIYFFKKASIGMKREKKKKVLKQFGESHDKLVKKSPEKVLVKS